MNNKKTHYIVKIDEFEDLNGIWIKDSITTDYYLMEQKVEHYLTELEKTKPEILKDKENIIVILKSIRCEYSFNVEITRYTNFTATLNE